MEKEKLIALGIENGELICTTIELIKENKGIAFHYIESEVLEELRQIDYWIENGRDMWVDAVITNLTDLGLVDFFKEEVTKENAVDAENFIGKNTLYYSPIGKAEREDADNFIKVSRKENVGTWEYDSFVDLDSHFDYPINQELINTL